MPGIVVASGPRAQRALDALAHDGWTTRSFAQTPNGLVVGSGAYEPYPIERVEDAGCIAVLEGAAYDRRAEELRATLGEFARSFARDPAAARSAAEAWATKTDGDFVVLVASLDGARALIVNDRLGRLPLYWASIDGYAAIAREIKCVRAACGAGDVDRHALAHILLFSFPLGTRTMHAHIARLPEASSLSIDASGHVDVRSYHQLDFQALHESAPIPDARELAERLADRTAAMAAWAKGRSIVLGLSGGLDSRAVAAALTRASATYHALTFVSQRKKAAEETGTSEQIARALSVPWESIVLVPPSWGAQRRMAVLRDGTSNVALAFMIDYFAAVRSRFGSDAIHFTGDGGDRALPDLRADVRIADLDAFVDYRLANALWPLDDAAALVGLRRTDVVESIRSHFAAYPERDPSFLNVRFMIADWAMCRLFCGEDRNRSFVWNASPFYAQSFFEAAMRAPLRRKRYYSLYADVLRALDPRLSGIAKSNWGHRVDSPMVRINAWRDAAAATFALMVKGRNRPREGRRGGAYGTSAHDPEFASLAQGNDGIGFDPARLRATVDRGLDKLQYHMLATALLYIDDVWGDRSSERAVVPSGGFKKPIFGQ